MTESLGDERPKSDPKPGGDKVSLRQRLHMATGDRDAEAEALADTAGGDVSARDAKVAVQLARGERGADESGPAHDVATPSDAEAVHDARSRSDE